MKFRNVVAAVLLLLMLTSCMTGFRKEYPKSTPQEEKPVDRSYLIEAYVPTARVVKTEQLVLDTTEKTDSPTGQTVTEAVPEETLARILDEPVLTDDQIAEKIAALEWHTASQQIETAEIKVIGEAPATEVIIEEEPEVVIVEEVLIEEEPQPEIKEEPADDIDPSMKGDQWQSMAADLSKTISEQAEPVESVIFEAALPPEELYEPVAEEIIEAETAEAEEIIIAAVEEALRSEETVIEEIHIEKDPEVISVRIEEVPAAEPEPTAVDIIPAASPEADGNEDLAPAQEEHSVSEEPAAIQSATASSDEPLPSSPDIAPAAEPTATGPRQTVFEEALQWASDHREPLFIGACGVMILLILVLLLTGGKKKSSASNEKPSKISSKKMQKVEEKMQKDPMKGFKYKADSWNVVRKEWAGE